ncbi:MAG: phage tail protein [Cytophagaceae bacterium]|nr:MAG: phage tail protein [Cytophagaceae bacterium]
MDVYIGMIGLFGFNYAPRGWMLCNGQLLPIAQYSALFSLIGTTYGGNGTTTFALPNLQGRVPLGFGQGPGLSNYQIGQEAGTETVTLLQTQMPAHTHPLMVSDQPASQSSPANSLLAVSGYEGSTVLTYGTTVDAIADPKSIGSSGGNQAHENMQPYLAMNYCIAVEGIYPSRP